MGLALVTGGTGFLGRRLVDGLLRHTDLKLCLFARDSNACGTFLSRHPHRHRVEVVRGNIVLPRLGLPSAVAMRLSASITEIWHLAASTSFHERDRAELLHTNVDGTRHILSFAARCHRLEQFYQMSTAFVAGKRTAPIPEGPFTTTAGFKNPYEESKFAAERIVRDSNIPYVILRPSIIMGDSLTGECGNDTRMMYGFVLGIWRAILHVFGSTRTFWKVWHSSASTRTAHYPVNVRVTTLASASTNLVTVDDAVRVCLAVRLARRDRSTYNIVNPCYLKNATIFEQIETSLKVRGLYCDHLLPLASREALSLPERIALRNTRPFWPYTTAPSPLWQTSATDALDVPRVVMTPRLFGHLLHTYFSCLAPR